MFVSAFGVEIEGNILAFLIELGVSYACEALGQRGLTNKLVRKLPRRKHRFGVDPSRLAKANIKRQWRRAGLRSGMVRKFEEYPLGLSVVVAEWNVRRGCRSRL